MTSFLQLRLALAVIGLIVWGYGYRVDDAGIRWTGIGCLALAVALRFVPKRLRRDDHPES